MKIIIYGADTNTYNLEMYVRQEHQVVGYVLENQDRCVESDRDKYFYPIYSVTDITTLDFDVVLIVAKDRRNVDSIRQNLQDEFGIDPQTILDFYQLFSEPKVDAVMGKDNKAYDGLILGLSHAAFGINSEYLDGNWCNLANGSQDLFYNRCMVEHCIKYYPDKIKNLKNVIIDMYDYVYFNWNVSLSKMILQYYAHGGYSYDLNDFSENANFTDELEFEMKKNGYHFGGDYNLKSYYRKTLFKEEIVQMHINEMYGDPEFFFYKDVQSEKLTSAIIQKNSGEDSAFFETTLFIKRFEETIQRNKKHFEEILRLLYSINKDMHIYTILIPRYHILEAKEEELGYMQDWKNDFEKIMNSFAKKYNIRYVNLKELEEISKEHEFYMDECHLNYNGSIQFTKYINQLMENIII